MEKSSNHILSNCGLLVIYHGRKQKKSHQTNPSSLRLSHHYIPIGSMYDIFTCIYHKFRPNVGKYTSPMDAMGYLVFHNISPLTWVFVTDFFRWLRDRAHSQNLSASHRPRSNPFHPNVQLWCDLLLISYPQMLNVWPISLHSGSFGGLNVPSLKLTYPLKMDGWKTTFLLGRPIFWGVCC